MWSWELSRSPSTSLLGLELGTTLNLLVWPIYTKIHFAVGHIVVAFSDRSSKDHSHFLGLTYLQKYSLCCGTHCCCFFRQEFTGPLPLPCFDLYITYTSCSDDFDCSLMFEEDKVFNLPKWVRHYANGSTWKRHSHSFPWFDLYPLHRMCTLLGGHWLLSNGS